MLTASAAPSRFAIVGTAGHIDHGKSTLVKALTGTDPDRLPEERARGMTIDLGFAHLDLPGLRLAIVDVPGHERFVRTMVAGASGIDLAMLVVAADDGVMPQTLEHMDILDRLGVHHGVIVVSKADAVSSERLAEVAAAAKIAAQRTPLSDWPVVSVSATRGDRLDELRATLKRIAEGLPERADSRLFRLAIDRVFTVRGRGTVVTGSVMHGRVAPGDLLELLPRGLRCRAREVQTHGDLAAEVAAGQRVAVNLTGVERQQIERGDELATPGALVPTRYVDVRLHVGVRRAEPLRSHRRVRVCLGTREEMAVAVCLESDEIAPGASAFVQLRLARPVVAAYGQRMIIREENASGTVGGAVVVRAATSRLGPKPSIVETMRSMESSDPLVRLDTVLRQTGLSLPSPLRLASLTGLEPRAVEAHLETLRCDGRLLVVDGTEVPAAAIDDLCGRGLAHLERNHRRVPQAPGLLADRFIGWLDRRSSPAIARAALARLRTRGDVVVRGPFVALARFRPALAPEDERILQRVVDELADAGLDPPEFERLTVVAGLTPARTAALREWARSEPEIVQVSSHTFAHRSAAERVRQVVRELGGGGRRFRLADVRDALSLSRRCVLPWLEYLDRTGFTRRVGDERVLTEKAL